MCKKTLGELDAVIRRVNTHPEYNRHQAQQFLQELRKEADNHSVVMEIEAAQSSSKHPWQESGKTNIKNRCDSLRRLEEAWTYVARNGLSIGTLMSLGNVIEPSEENQGFRKKDVVFGAFDGADPSKIANDIYNVLLDVEALRSHRRHPVIIASVAHIGMVNVHPYLDGNGRAARIVQEFILQSDGYTPAIIPASEGLQYRKLMANVLNDRRHVDSTPFKASAHENAFYDYIASKSLLSARNLESNLLKNRVYRATVEGVNNGTKFSLKHRLVGLNSTTPETISVRILNQQGSGSQAVYEVKGNVSLGEVQGIIQKAASSYNLNRFSVVPYQLYSESAIGE